ncbi:M56 family metallopeptidase [Paenibacillus antri]|uniref:M56 family metallopeptidase n=1 Tax=Paenibacillus antri TaxID=2582848 RepID=A0A5R9GF27_9BACL|nr:M56 family metallopeptidase [Paenibacillus antri]TLS50005.1 M56 family metallopeptidase [Paenibacillus antri]
MRRFAGYRVTFISVVILGFFLLSQMILFIVHQIWDVDAGWNIVQYCLTAVQGLLQRPIVTAVLFDIFIAYTFAKMGIRLYRQWKQHRSWLYDLRFAEDCLLTEKIRKQFSNDSLVVVKHQTWFAFVFGMWKPKIALSSAMVSNLSEEELKAVIFHEVYHSNRFHPVKLLIVTLFAEGFSYLPIFRQVQHYYKCWTEIEADRYALDQTGDLQSLGSALLKMIRCNEENDSLPSAVHFADYAVNYRIKHLLVPEEPIRIRAVSRRAFTVSCIGILVMMNGMIGGCLS